MSRYCYQPPGWPYHIHFFVGWDEPLDTYFGQVVKAADYEETAIIWLGGMPPHYHGLDELLHTLNGCLAACSLPPIRLPKTLRAKLERDKRRSQQPHRRREQPQRQRKPMFALDLFPPDDC